MRWRTGITVCDLEASISFWTDVTGVDGPLARSRFAYLRNRDGSNVELIQNPPPLSNRPRK
jgi:hypothetical protein